MDTEVGEKLFREDLLDKNWNKNNRQKTLRRMEFYISGHHIYTHLQKEQRWEITQHVCRLKGKSNREGETDDVEERC